MGQVPPVLEWVLLATKTDGSYVTHAHYTNEKALESSPRPHLAITEETWQSGNELYLRGY